jgi:hypothetical protein
MAGVHRESPMFDSNPLIVTNGFANIPEGGFLLTTGAMDP